MNAIVVCWMEFLGGGRIAQWWELWEFWGVAARG